MTVQYLPVLCRTAGCNRARAERGDGALLSRCDAHTAELLTQAFASRDLPLSVRSRPDGSPPDLRSAPGAEQAASLAS